MSSTKRWLTIAAGILLSAVLLMFAVRNVDGHDLAEVLSTARWWVIAPFLVALMAFYWIKTVRWAYLLRTIAPNATRRLFAAVMIGYAAGAILPLQLGEVVRAWLGAQRLKIRVLASFMSIALERVFDLLSILFVAAIAFTMTRTSSTWLASAIYIMAAGCFVLLVLFVVFVFRTEQCLALSERLLRPVPAALRGRILEHLRAGATGLHALRSASTIAILFGMSVLQWLFMFGCVWLSLYAMHLQLPLVAATLVSVLCVIGMSLPNSPGYVGSIQLAFTLALQPFGVGPTDAVAASLFFHVLSYGTVILIGFGLLPTVGLTVKEVTRGASGAVGGNSSESTVEGAPAVKS